MMLFWLPHLWWFQGSESPATKNHCKINSITIFAFHYDWSSFVMLFAIFFKAHWYFTCGFLLLPFGSTQKMPLDCRLFIVGLTKQKQETDAVESSSSEMIRIGRNSTISFSFAVCALCIESVASQIINWMATESFAKQFDVEIRNSFEKLFYNWIRIMKRFEMRNANALNTFAIACMRCSAYCVEPTLCT